MIVLIPRGSLYILDAVSLILHTAWYYRWILGFALYGRYCKYLLPFCGLLLLILNRSFLSEVQFINLFSCLCFFIRIFSRVFFWKLNCFSIHI